MGGTRLMVRRPRPTPLVWERLLSAPASVRRGSVRVALGGLGRVELSLAVLPMAGDIGAGGPGGQIGRGVRIRELVADVRAALVVPALWRRGHATILPAVHAPHTSVLRRRMDR
jgi:hypothetical protein